MLSNKKRHRFLLAFIRYICLLMIPVVLMFILFECKARTLVHNLVDNELEIHAMNAIDKAVYDVLSEEPIEYLSIVKSDVGSDGKVNALYTDTAAMNLLKSEMSLKITDGIRKSHNARVGVPAGAFTGLVLLSNIGPDIYVSLSLDGSVSTTIRSEFVSAGINQTMHRVYMEVEANVSLTCPIITYETEFVTEYELCQTIIVGNTPQMFATLK